MRHACVVSDAMGTTSSSGFFFFTAGYSCAIDGSGIRFFPDRPVQGQRPDGDSHSLSRGRAVLAGPRGSGRAESRQVGFRALVRAAVRVLLVFYSTSWSGGREPSDKAGKLTR